MQALISFLIGVEGVNALYSKMRLVPHFFAIILIQFLSLSFLMPHFFAEIFSFKPGAVAILS